MTEGMMRWEEKWGNQEKMLTWEGKQE